jgi:hypothetical protein
MRVLLSKLKVAFDLTVESIFGPRPNIPSKNIIDRKKTGKESPKPLSSLPGQSTACI